MHVCAFTWRTGAESREVHQEGHVSPLSVLGRMVQPVRLAGVSPVQMGRVRETRDVKK